MKDRFKEIDLMRGVAMLAVMLNHTVVYFSTSNTAIFLANVSQFSVQVLLFCSAYIFWQRYEKGSHPHVLTYFKKRFLRLLIPYYIFIFFWFLAIYYFEPTALTAHYIFVNLLMIDGVAINWLVLLFLIFALLLPFLAKLHLHRRIIFYGYSFVALLSSILFLWYHPPIPYQFINWLPWSLVILMTFAIVYSKENITKQLYLFGVSLIGFVLSWYILQSGHLSLLFYDNKYPPNLYLLSFGFLAIFMLLWLFTKVQTPKILDKIVSFFSIYSFEVYFIHFLLIYVVSKTVLYKYPFNWFTFFLLIVVLSVGVQLLLVKVRVYLKR